MSSKSFKNIKNTLLYHFRDIDNPQIMLFCIGHRIRRAAGGAGDVRYANIAVIYQFTVACVHTAAFVSWRGKGNFVGFILDGFVHIRVGLFPTIGLVGAGKYQVQPHVGFFLFQHQYHRRRQRVKSQSTARTEGAVSLKIQIAYRAGKCS